jgi:hypothetical protein
MPVPTNDTLFEGSHKGTFSPADPNLYSLGDLAAAMGTDSLAVSVATSKSVSSINAAAPDSSSISAANSRATSSGTQASIADSKAISGSSITSVADSKAISVSSNTSVADSKAVSIDRALIIPAVGTLPGFQQPFATATIRTANTKMAERVSVRDFGAMGDGIVNDTNAFRNAIAALTSGGTVVVPRGTYLITSQVSISQHGIRLEFESGSVVQAAVIAGDVGVFLADTKNNVSVTGLRMTGSFPWGIYISGGSGHRISDCTISGGTIPASGKCGGIYHENVSDFLIERVTCSGNGVVTGDAGADIQCNNGDTIVTDGVIRDCNLSSTLVTINCCIYNPLRVVVERVTVSGARVFASSTDAGGYGVLFYKTSGIVASQVGYSRMVDCHASATQGVGLNVQGDVQHSPILHSKSIGCCTAQTGTSLTVGGIVHEGSYGVVDNCDVIDSASHGIAVGGSFNHGKVTTCRVSAPALDGVIFNGALSDSTIENCDVDTVTGHLAYGTRNFVDMAVLRCAIRNSRARTVQAAAFFPPSSDGCIIDGVISTGLNDEAYIALNQGTNAVVRGNIGNSHHFPEGVSSDRGDASVTIVHGQDFETQLFRTALTSDRTITLSAVNAKNGARFRIVRTALGAHTLDVGGLKTIPNSTAAFVDVEYAIVSGVGSFWMLTGYGTL